MPLAHLPFANNRPPEERVGLTKEQLLGHNEEKTNKYLMLMEWHGITDITVSGGEFIGNCPFFDCPGFIESKSPHFSANRQTMEWQCFHCGRKGNKTTFIRDIHTNSLSQTTEDHLRELIRLRKGAIDIEELMEMQVALNPITKEWSCPVWNTEGKIANLYIWKDGYDPDSGKQRRQFYSSPSIPHVPYGIHRVRHGTNRPLWVLEGQWDYLAFAGLLRRLKISSQFDIVAAPGAGTFPRKHLSIFNGREVILCFDNDKAGTAGMDGLINAMAGNSIVPTSCKRIHWPTELAAGFDVSDVITHLPQSLWKKPEKK